MRSGLVLAALVVVAVTGVPQGPAQAQPSIVSGTSLRVAGIAGPTVTGLVRPTRGFDLAPIARRIGLRRSHTGWRGLNLARPLTRQSAVAFNAGTGPRRDAPDLRITLGLQYTF